MFELPPHAKKPSEDQMIKHVDYHTHIILILCVHCQNIATLTSLECPSIFNINNSEARILLKKNV